MDGTGRKIVAIGELLVDFVPGRPGVSVRDAESFHRAAGGAPANAAAAAARLGAPAAFIGRVGNDAFGRWLRDTLGSFGVDTRALRFDRETATTLAFVSLAEDGDRDFLFYRDGTADTRLAVSDLDDGLLRSAGILHFCSISLSREPARGTTFEAVRRAALADALISFDLNWRPALWPDPAAAGPFLERAAREAHLLKLSSDELKLLTGSSDPASAEALFSSGPLRAVVVSRGARGLTLLSGGERSDVPAWPVKAVDTTGAGDALAGAILQQLLGQPELLDSHVALREAARTAAAVAALSTLKPGAMPSYPDQAELAEFLRQNA